MGFNVWEEASLLGIRKISEEEVLVGFPFAVERSWMAVGPGLLLWARVGQTIHPVLVGNDAAGGDFSGALSSSLPQPRAHQALQSFCQLSWGWEDSVPFDIRGLAAWLPLAPLAGIRSPPGAGLPLGPPRGPPLRLALGCGLQGQASRLYTPARVASCAALGIAP